MSDLSWKFFSRPVRAGAGVGAGSVGVALMLAVLGCSSPTAAPETPPSAPQPGTPAHARAEARQGAYACTPSPTPPAEIALTPPGPGAPAIGTAPRLAYPGWIRDAADALPSIGAIERAAAPYCAQPVPPGDAEALAGGGRAVAACCASGVASPFRRGCDDASACRLVVPAGGGHRAVTSEADLAAALAPIDSPAEAVGLVALLHPEVQIPFGEDHATVLSEYAQLYRWQPYSAAPIAVEAETYSWGFAVRVPVVRFCGCRHGFVRVAYRVGRDGAVCRMDEPPLPIAYAHGDTCIQ